MQHRVVIVGCGFGGLFAARALRRAPVELTVVDRRNHHLFQPLLYQMSTGILSEGDIAPPIRGVLRRQRNATVLMGDVEAVDLAAPVAARPVAGRRGRRRLRQPDRRGRRAAVVLRPPGVRGVRAGDEVDRGRAPAARADLRRLRGGGGRARSGAAEDVADVRRGRRRRHRRRDGGPDRRALAPRPARQLPADRPGGRPGGAARRRPDRAGGVPAEAAGQVGTGARADGRRAARERAGDRRRCERRRRRRRRPDGAADRRADADLVRRRRGVAAGGDAGRAERRDGRPRRAASRCCRTARCRATPRCSWSAT